MLDTRPKLSRRSFLKASGALGALAAAGGAVSAGEEIFGSKVPEAHAESDTKIVWNHCAINCPCRCSLKLYVKDDEIVKVDTYSTGTYDFEDIQPKACLRGRSYRAWVNHPDRINYPLKRSEGSKRGDCKYEQISWEEAIDIIAKNYKDVLENYGPEAVYVNYASGSSSTTARSWSRLTNLLGGSLGYYGNYSQAQHMWIAPYIYGGGRTLNSTINTAKDAKVIIRFGNNQVVTRQGGGSSHHDFVALREQTDAKIYHIDPMFSQSAQGHSDTWVPINPGTDAAFCSAVAYELISNDWIDKDFLDTYCVGYDEKTMPESAKGKNLSYKDYIMGTGYDMTEKTPEWAAPICGIPVEKIKEIAKEIGTNSPVYIDQGYGVQRRSNGEMSVMSICMLPILTGNIGLPGTSIGLRDNLYTIGLESLPSGDNPVKAKISMFSMADAIDRGTEMTKERDGIEGVDKLSTNIKFVINWAGNCITNQNSDINWVHDIMVDEDKCQFVLGSDILMTDSLKYSDVILPDMFRLEQESVIDTGAVGAYMIAGQPPYAPKFEWKTAYEAASLIADAMGVGEEFTEGKTESDWIKELYEKSRLEDPELPTYDDFVEMGVYTRKNPEGAIIGLKDFREDPVANPLETPSGKIEIYSEQLAKHIAEHEYEDDDKVAAIGIYTPEWYGVETVTDEYPLALTGYHYSGRQHSSWGDVDILKEQNPQELWINPNDAEPRGINQGDTVRVKNDFGITELLAKVTPRIVPGTVAMAQGAWHDADMDGDRIDKGGCINTLTTHRPTPLAKGNPQHTNICQVEKI